MNRMKTFHNLIHHAWYGHLYRKLSTNELEACENFIAETFVLTATEFCEKLMLKDFATKNRQLMNELLLVTGRTSQ